MAEAPKPDRLSVAQTARSNRLMLLAWILGLMLVSATLYGLNSLLPLASWLETIKGWVHGSSVWGPVVYGLVDTAALVLMIPAWPLTVTAGVLFGLGVGTVVASVASTAAAAISFSIARYLARDSVARRIERDRRFAAIDRAIEERGWLVVALLRLSPAVPFNLQNYLYGLTAIGFRVYILTSWLTMLPGTLMYVWLGAAGRAGAESVTGAGARHRSATEWAFLMVGLASTIAVTMFISRLAMRAVRRASVVEEADRS
jgi:uncharacterized membrane protein YdjX (TVP38/TMEM64 family)